MTLGEGLTEGKRLLASSPRPVSRKATNPPIYLPLHSRGRSECWMSPTPKKVYLSEALAAPTLAPKHDHASATVVTFASWRMWRGARCVEGMWIVHAGA